MSNQLVNSRAEIMAVVIQLKAAWTDYPLVVEVDNSEEVDEKAQLDPYLQVSVVNLSGEQLDLGDDPTTQQWGQILLTACTRSGGGTAAGLKLLAFAGRYFSTTDFTTVRCKAFQATGGKTIKGWWRESGIINYWFCWRKSE